MDTLTVLLWLCAVHSVGFALFHVAFRKLFDWPRSLRSTTLANRAIIQILNLRLIWVLLCVTAALALLPGEIIGSRLGRALLAAMARCSGSAAPSNSSSCCASMTAACMY